MYLLIVNQVKIMMFDIINLVYTIFVLSSNSNHHDPNSIHDDPDIGAKKLILTLTVAFLIFGIAYLVWQSFFVIPSE
tara:strand:+ start:14903 stop:15133 length:231 start_codon:yes stop_codon:yes gene_type:complete